MTAFDNQFFNALHGSSLPAARAVVPRLVRLLAPRSVADVGCGTGLWLAEFLGCGVHDLLGIDGPWVPDALFRVPPAAVRRHDLAQPFAPPRRFDLVLCLRVAEHLPVTAAGTLVATVASLGDVVLFTTATPGHGAHGHRDGQEAAWWDRLFAARGFLAYRGFGATLARDRDVDGRYSRGMVFYARRGAAPGVDLELGHLRGAPRVVRPSDILPVVMTCARDVGLTGRFVDSFAERVGAALPRPLVSVDLTPGPNLPAGYWNGLARLRPAAVVRHHRPIGASDRASVADAAYSALDAGLHALGEREYLLFIEDDVLFSRGFIAHLSQLLLPPDAGLHTFYRPAGRPAGAVIEPRHFLGTQCVLFPAKAARDVLGDRCQGGPPPAPSYDLRWARSLAASGYALYGSAVSYVQHADASSRYGSGRHRSDSFVE